MVPDPDKQLYHVTVTLTEPTRLDGSAAEFDVGFVASVELAKPASAAGWLVSLPSPARCVVHADIEAERPELATFGVQEVLFRAIFPSVVRPRVVDIRAMTIRVEVSYVP